MMKYIVEYLEQEMNIHPMGEVTLIPCDSGADVGYTVVIGGKTTSLDVWWIEYTTWLEKKLEEKGINSLH